VKYLCGFGCRFKYQANFLKTGNTGTIKYVSNFGFKERPEDK
jgi:hypothetical protein